MANRYWVGGTGTWSDVNTTNWSATSGGAGGASVPTTADTVIFDTNSNIAGSGASYTCTRTATGTALSMSLDKPSATSATVTLAGSTTFYLQTGGTLTVAATGVVWTNTGVLAVQGSHTFNTNGVSLASAVTLNAGTLTVSSNFVSTGASGFSFTAGTLDITNVSFTCLTFSSSNTSTRSIAFGTTGQITVTGSGTVWDTGVVTGLTTSGTQVVNVTNATATATTVTVGALNEANSISFNFTAGTYALTLTAGSWRNLNFTGWAGTFSADNPHTIYGNLTMAVTPASYTFGTGTWTFAATSTGKTITSNGQTMNWPITFDGIGGSWILQDTFTLGPIRTLTHSNGTIDLNGKTLTWAAADTATGSYTTAAGTKNLTFNGGNLGCPGGSATPFNNVAPTGFTTTAGTGSGTISMTGATAKTFVGGGSTFRCTLNQGGAGTLTITGSNTFDNITNTVQPASILFTAGTTTTFNNFNLRGTSGNLITIGSDTAASHTLSKVSGIVSGNFLSISRSTATGGATWYAGANSIDGLNNTGWLFSNAPPGLSFGNGLTITGGITYSA